MDSDTDSDDADGGSVCSEIEDGIPEALDHEEDELSACDESDDEEGIVISDEYIGKDGTVWSTIQEENPEKFECNPGPSLTDYSEAIISPLDAFLKFFDQNVMDIILYNINLHAEGDADWVPLTYDELLAFLSVLVVIGVTKSRKRSIKSLWSTDHFFSIPFYNAVFSRHRFESIMSHFRFDATATRMSRIQETGDKLEAIREFSEAVRKNCIRAYNPSRCLTVDERLHAFRGKFFGKVYMPAKPGKIGIKLWVGCDAVNSYAHNFQVYYPGSHLLSKNCEAMQPSTASEEITSTKKTPAHDQQATTSSARKQKPTKAQNPRPTKDVNQGKRVLLDMAEDIEGSGREIVADNLFIYAAAAEALYRKRLYLTGTVRSARREVPREFLPKRSRQEHSRLVAYNGVKTLTSYVNRPNKAVVFLSTNPDMIDTTTNDDNMPLVNDHYNLKKCGVDILDKITKEVSVSKPTKRWPMAIFYDILEMVLHNSFVIYTTKFPCWKQNNTCKREFFLKELAFRLAENYVQRRLNISESGGVHDDLKREMKMFLLEVQKLNNNRSITCVLCNIQENLQVCYKCENNFCETHSSKQKIYRCCACLGEPSPHRKEKGSTICYYCTRSKRKSRVSCSSCETCVCIIHRIVTVETLCSHCS